MSEGKVFCPLRNDRAFKAIMKKNPRVLEALISDFLGIEKSEIKNAVILDPNDEGDNIRDKGTEQDLKVLVNDSMIINLEMQNYWESGWKGRSLIYTVRNLAKVEYGGGYANIKPVYQMCFLGFELLEDNPVFYANYVLRDKTTHVEYTDLISISVVDMTKIDKARDTPFEQKLAGWARMFAADSEEEIEKYAAGDEVFEDMVVTYKQYTDEEKEYWRREKELDLKMRQADARNEGRKESQEKIDRLIKLLIKDGRIDDLRRSAEDASYKEQLMKEYGIEYYVQ